MTSGYCIQHSKSVESRQSHTDVNAGSCPYKEGATSLMELELSVTTVQYFQEKPEIQTLCESFRFKMLATNLKKQETNKQKPLFNHLGQTYTRPYSAFDL